MRQLCMLVLSLVLAACAGATSNPGTPTPQAIDAAVVSINVNDVQRRIAFLASDELRGRDTPSPGLEAASRYAADEFRRIGLQPAGDSGTFIQRFPFDASSLDLDAVLVESRATTGGAAQLTFATDFFVVAARIDSVVGMPIFLGPARPGIMPPSDAAGRPLMFFVQDTASVAWQTAVGGVLQSALAGRASAAIVIFPPEFSSEAFAELAHQLAGQILPVPMPIVGLSYDAAKRIFAQTNLDLDAIRMSTSPQALDAVRLAIRTPVSGETVMVPNIVGILPGRDTALSREFVVFSAHIDHVGVGAPDETGDSIYNGADDDASGTTAVLEIAEAFASLPTKPARSIMFLLVSGEEKGLLGSAYFVENPPVQQSQMVANINIDMIGRNAPDTVVAIGQDYSSLGPTVQRIATANPQLGLVVAPDLWPEEQLFFRSDHFSFATKEIPAIFFTTGLHDDYHKPSDEPETIDNNKVERIARLLFHLAYDVANASDRPQWTQAGLDAVRNAMR